MKIELTRENLKELMPDAKVQNIEKYLPYLKLYLGRYGINTDDRVAVFLAQVGHESGSFNYSKEIWGNTPAQLRYEGRSDLGNTKPGDGRKYMGRGLIQVTGRANYVLFNEWLHTNEILSANESIVTNPDLVSDRADLAVLSAIWYWEIKGLNKYADRK